MTRTFLLAFLITSTCAFGQSPASHPNTPVTMPAQFPDINTTLRVVHSDGLTDRQLPAWFLNGQQVGYSPLAMLNPDQIQDMKVVNSVVQINGITYREQLYVTTKSSYTPQLISLTALKKKYTRLGDEPTLFFIGDGYVNERYDTYLIDEKALSSIVLNTIKNAHEAINMHVVKLIMKRDNVSRNPADIRLRGGEVGLSEQRTTRLFTASK